MDMEHELQSFWLQNIKLLVEMFTRERRNTILLIHHEYGSLLIGKDLLNVYSLGWRWVEKSGNI